MDSVGLKTCPFCGYGADGNYQIELHVATKHPEGGDSPFIVKDDTTIEALVDLDSHNGDEEEYFHCSVEGCGEDLLEAELESHVEMHEAEQDTGDSDDSDHSSDNRPKHKPAVADMFNVNLSHALRHQNNDDDDDRTVVPRVSSSHRHTTKNTSRWRRFFKMSVYSPRGSSSMKPAARGQLGKSELGPYAREKQMPSWLVKLLEDDGAVKTSNVSNRDGKMRKVKICPNMTAGIVPVLEQLLDQDEQVEFAFLCDPAVKHVSKLRREGGFCGYRNIQMLCSYIIGAESQGYECFDKKVPSIFQIQDYIESAWDFGINATGRIETGGIRGTRKYIGTPEAQAMFCSIGIACDAQGLKSGNSGPAHELLFRTVENYFINGCIDYNPKIRCTSLPPIYFQRPGHSMTIVGFERKRNGSKSLIVFDPMFHDADSVTKRIGKSFRSEHPAHHLRAYRRDVKYLKKFNEFELLKLTPPPKI
ncbi:peptidase family C78-domain-containing protein [Rhexocercosporidium sp. MPI-PUGE-AT-0058]|nr:peptidase family C78-domain-containing protein [Rhexocercosporidium sp. MPI-PUGE-AT-0058]